MRTGSEPITARSPLRMRLWLSVWAMAWGAFGLTAFILNGRAGWATACGVLLLVVIVDFCVVVRHIRQGPHFQPGPEIAPYEPDHGTRTGTGTGTRTTPPPHGRGRYDD